MEKKIILIFISVLATTIAVFGLIFMLLTQNSSNDNYKSLSAAIDNEGNQIIELKAKGGYEPKVSAAKADKPIILKVNTNGTYDCSSSFSIPKLGINKNLPATGNTEFQIPPQKAGTTIDGMCGMGMFKFKINIV